MSFLSFFLLFIDILNYFILMLLLKKKSSIYPVTTDSYLGNLLSK